MRHKVNRAKSARQFNRNTKRTKAANLYRPMRGGQRM